MSHWKALLAGFGILTVVGCTTTPDLSGWAQNSANLAGAVASENKQVLQRLDQDIAELQVGEAEGWNLASHSYVMWKQHRDDYQKNSSNISAVMDAMVLYANALAKLAAAGETGKESVEKMNQSAKEIVELVGQSHPISAGTLAVLEAFAHAWTKKEAQDSLAATMTKIDPKVGAMSDLVAQAVVAQKGIIRSINTLERRLIRQAAGPNRMSWYKKNKGYLKVENAFKDDADVERTAAVTYLIESLEPRFRERHERRVSSTQWKQARIRALDAVARSATVWRQSHLDAATLLAECGGLRSPRFRCGNFTAANLKLAADQIKSAVAGTAPAASSGDD